MRLLSLGAASQTARNAENALEHLLEDDWLANRTLTAVATLEAEADEPRVRRLAQAWRRGSHSGFDEVWQALRTRAEEALGAAQAGADEPALEASVAAAAAMGVAPSRLEAARHTFDASRRAAAAAASRAAERKRKQDAIGARRHSMGLGEARVPHDFCCPITHVEMDEPVVASDGHSYERAALARWMADAAGGVARSPVTNEPIRSAVFPNHALRKRIDAYQEELLEEISEAVDSNKRRRLE